jgi:uncharacterized protein YbjT (DUF2867 family)
MSEATAIVIGATGLVGGLLTRQLLADTRYERVILFSRRSAELSHGKLTEHLVDFEDLPSWQDRIRGDVLFSTLGTTMKEAGSRAAFARIDHDYPLSVATQARQNGVSRAVWLSSIGASARSLFVYLASKGRLDDAVSALGFEHTVILKPSALVGERLRPRSGEKAGIVSLRAVTRALPGMAKLRPVDAVLVARAMAELGVTPLEGERVTFASDQISTYAQGLAPT